VDFHRQWISVGSIRTSCRPRPASFNGNSVVQSIFRNRVALSFVGIPSIPQKKRNGWGTVGSGKNQNALDGEAAIFISVWYSPPFGESD
jgi:hypothetical protein